MLGFSQLLCGKKMRQKLRQQKEGAHRGERLHEPNYKLRL
jgi:hypothetical protein